MNKYQEFTHMPPSSPALAADVCVRAPSARSSAPPPLFSSFGSFPRKKLTFSKKKNSVSLNPPQQLPPPPPPPSAAGCLLLRSSVSMATEVNPALPLRMLAVACVCLSARLRSPATLVAFVFLWRCRIADKSNLKVVCVFVYLPSLISTV